jgi:hypothetical protein
MPCKKLVCLWLWPLKNRFFRNAYTICALSASKKKLALSKILPRTFLWPQCTVTITILRTGRMRAVKKSDLRQIIEYISFKVRLLSLAKRWQDLGRLFQYSRRSWFLNQKRIVRTRARIFKRLWSPRIDSQE